MDIKKILIRIAYTIGTIVILIWIAYEVINSDFSKIKKYDEDDKTPRKDMPISKEKQRYAAARYYTTAVEVKDNGMISLGDFTMSLSNGKVLTANISVQYKNNSNWFAKAKEESDIVSKSGVLRNSVINAIHGTSASTNSQDVKDRIKQNLNQYLSDGEVEEVYFNKFIIQ